VSSGEADTLREVVIHGIVEVMNERQVADRTESLGAALSRMSSAREERNPITTLDARFGLDADPFAVDEPAAPRRRLLGFGDRARAAVRRMGND
jgi:hypothetical protein